MAVEFSEANSAWTPIPAWANFLLEFGYRWPTQAPGERRIALISMPCDSAAAGLITLGALIRDLGNPSANNSDRHYDAMLQYARQFIECCRECELDPCDPETKGCGYLSRATGRVRQTTGPQGTYEVSDRTDLAGKQIAFFRRGVIIRPKPRYATDWYIDGDPPPEANNPDGELPTLPYQQVMPDAVILPDNVRKSYSGLCLAGRAAGEAPTRSACAALRFRNGSATYGLEALLTVQGWSQSNLSRVSFFNTLTDSLDRNPAAPALVIADGDAAFLNAFSRQEFRQSDMVGLIHRTMDRDKLEAVGNKMLQQSQWYRPDAQLLSRVPRAPRGTSVSILRRGE